MNKREIREHFQKTFLFDVRKERIIYAYLCKEKLSWKQKKLLTDETKFQSYQSWKSYIVGKYEAYPKAVLIEFSKAINLLLRESRKFDKYNRGIWIVCISVLLSELITDYISEVGKSVVLMLVTTFFVAIFIFVLVTKVYKYFGEEDTYFYEDIKDIITQMMEER